MEEDLLDDVVPDDKEPELQTLAAGRPREYRTARRQKGGLGGDARAHGGRYRVAAGGAVAKARKSSSVLKS